MSFFSTWYGILIIVLVAIFIVFPILAIFIMGISAVLTSIIVIPLLFLFKAIIKHVIKKVKAEKEKEKAEAKEEISEAENK